MQPRSSGDVRFPYPLPQRLLTRLGDIVTRQACATAGGHLTRPEAQPTRRQP